MDASSPLTTHHSNPHFFERGNLAFRVWGITASALLIIGSYLAWSSYDEFGKTLEHEYRLLETHARFGDAQVAGSLRSIDLLLQDVIDDRLSTPDLPADVIQRHQLDKLRQFPEIRLLITTDNKGQVASAESLDDPMGVIDVRKFDASQRDYFTVHRDAKPEDYYRYQLSRPFKTITNRNTITVSRAIRGKKGQFQGVALVSLSPAYFDSVLQEVLANNVADAAAVHNRFGDIIYRKPDPDKYVGKNIAGGEAFQSYLRSDQHLTRYLGVTATDGVKRILVFSKVGDTNLDVGVSAQFDVVMAGWRSNLLVKALFFVMVSGLSLALAFGSQQRLLERRRSEVTLRESEERYRLLVKTASEGILVAQGASLQFVNPMVMEITGYTEEELTSRPFLEFIHQDDRELMKANYLKRIKGEPVPQRYPIRILTKEAGEKWVELSGARIEWQGQPATLNFVTDITEHRQAEQASKDSYERLVTVLNSLDAIVYVSDIETYEVLFVNQFVQGIFGDIVGQPCWKSLQSGQSGPCSFCTNNKLLDTTGNPTGIYHWEFQNSVNGRWYDIRDRAITWPNGRFVRLEIATDITERKQSHDEIARLMREQQIILDTAPVGISMIIDRKQVWVNRKAEAMFQYSPQEMVGQTTRMLYPTQQAYDQLGQEAYQALSSGDEFVTVQNLIRRDGTPIWVKYEGKAVDPADMSKGTIWILDDITERKQAEDELLRSNTELEQFSYAISHDMRQPLRMISSYMQLLEKSLADHLDTEKRQFFGFAIDGAKRMDAMMLGLLEYSRVGRKGEPPKWIESRSLLDDALLFLQPAIAESHADIRIEGEWPRIHVSPDEMLRLMQNLIGNALKFLIAGRTSEVIVTSEIVDKEWRLCVADNGVGIIPDQIGRLFQVFQRLQGRTSYEGNGIGLALCRKIAEHHGGRIWAESEGEGKGSKFCVSLPQQRVEL